MSTGEADFAVDIFL